MISTVQQSYCPCLLGPRHGWIVRTRPPKPFAALADDQGNRALYQRCRFLSEAGEIWWFYCWPFATDEEQEKAVDDYLFALRYDQHERTHEEPLDLPALKISTERRR